MKSGLAILFAASFGIQPLPQPDGPLEPSVQNEVDHAVALGERWLAAVAGRPPDAGTDGENPPQDKPEPSKRKTTRGKSAKR